MNIKFDHCHSEQILVAKIKLIGKLDFSLLMKQINLQVWMVFMS